MAALMPSAIPTLPGRPGHRRSYTTTTTTTTASGPGAFASLGALPHRRQQQQQKKTVFSLNGNDDEEEDSHDDSHDDDDVLHNVPPALRLNPNNSLRLSVSTSTDDDALLPMRTSPTKANIPFPRSSVPASPTELTHSAPLSRPGMTRTASTPIILSTGKPLKSSLKSSSSSPHIPFPPQQQQSPGHLRARSAPSTPHLEQLPSPVPKNVHFPTNEEGGLATVRIYNRSARPASLLTKSNGEDTETETEGELSTGSSGIIRGFSAVSQPFPRSPLGGHHHHHHYRPTARYEIDSEESSSVPIKNPPHANVYLESISYTPRSSLGTPQGLSGTLLVRNIAYEKLIAVRFTLDDWQTTSEVSARHVTSLHTLPPVFRPSSQSMTYGDVAQAISSTPIPTDAGIPQWDRFGFTIKLEDYAANLSKRTIFLVVRYTANAITGPVESWDNNMGQNYKIVFKELPVAPTSSSTTTTTTPIPQRTRGFTVSSPLSFGPVMTPTTAMSLNSTSSSLSPFREPQHAQMVAQTTLLRLKKLNLRNYAAPSNPSSSTTNASTSNATSPSSSVTVSIPASSLGPPFLSGVAVDTSTDEGVSGAGSSVYSVGAKEAISAQGVGVLQKDVQGRERMEEVAPAHVGVGSNSISVSSAVETRVTVDVREEDGTSSDEESLKTPTAVSGAGDSGMMKSRSGSLTGFIQEFQFPAPSPSSPPTKARITSDPIPILTFSSSSSPSLSASSGSPELTTPSLNGLMPIDINRRRNHNRPDVLSPIPLEMGTSPPFSTLPEYTLINATKRREMMMNGHGHSLSHPSARPNNTTTPPSIMTQIDHYQRNDNSKDTDNDNTTGGAAVYFPWGLSAGTQAPKSPEEVKKMLEGIREKSTSSPVRRSPTNSGRTSPVKRGSSLSPVRVSETTATTATMMNDGKEGEREREEVVSPQPRKDWSKVGGGGSNGNGGWNSNSSRAAGIGHPRASPIMMNTSSLKPSSSSPSTPTSSNVNGNGNSDSIYQAVVRQWCFAQGPSPVSLGPASTAHSQSQSQSQSQLHSTQGQQSRYRNGRGGAGDSAGLVV